MTTHTDGHVFDDLPLLLAGEADRPTVLRAAGHLRGCSDCREDLVDAVIAHATLRSAARIAPDIASGGRLPMPGEDDLLFGVGHAVAGDYSVAGGHAIAGGGRTVGSAAADGGAHEDVAGLLAAAAIDSPSADAPIDLSPVFAQIRREAAEAKAGAATSMAVPAAGTDGRADDPAHVDTADSAAPSNVVPLRRRRVQRALLAAAAVIVVGGGTAAIVSQTGDDGRTVPVSAFGAGTVPASATVGNGWVRLDASKLPTLPIDEYYEVWLVDRPQTGVLALGSLGADRTGTFALPPAVMSNYPTVQVTVQQNNGDPRPSDTSVLRGTI